jgi:hypothetical protein
MNHIYRHELNQLSSSLRTVIYFFSNKSLKKQRRPQSLQMDLTSHRYQLIKTLTQVLLSNVY